MNKGMDTVVLSDLHLGNGQGYDIFAGEKELPAFLNQLPRPARVVLNGDTVDFLMNEDPLELDVSRAVRQARALVAAVPTAAVFAALGRVLASGGEVLVHLGNHDLELALAEVQEVFRQALGQPPEVARRLAFERGDHPLVLDVGGAQVLLTHGEQMDRWNKVDYPHLPGPGAPEGATAASFEYAPGSMLVKKLLNPLKREHGLRFVDLLVPDFQGAVLAALAVDPSIFNIVCQKASFNILGQLLRRESMPATFDPGQADPELGLAVRLKVAGLSAKEQAALFGVLGDAAISFGEPALGFISAQQKLGRAALSIYARMQRQVVGDSGERRFLLEPLEGEMDEAHRLAEKFGAGAVITGHTHAARWKVMKDGVVCVNTGTWIWLMRLPSPNASDEEWTAFLEELQHNPGLSPERQKLARLQQRFTAAVCRPHKDGGAEVSLVEWKSSRTTVLASARVPPGTRRA